MIFLVLINTALFIMLSFVHVYWAMGGNLGSNGSIPTLNDGTPVYKPGIVGTFAVAAALGSFAFIIIGNLDLYDEYIPPVLIRYTTICIGVLFLLRAMGDFKYMGFFKKTKGTLFSKNDSRYYTPLCLFIGISCIAIALLK